jgi:L-glyceraldehyde 3-phosphate reductase
MATYTPAPHRYSTAPGWFRRCGRSGIVLPAISLGMWHNFGTDADHENCRKMCFTAFDLGITHFDLANNYGPIPGAAEERTGRILKEMPRDELIISSKAGYTMWPGPYGDNGSRKYLIASLDQSLKRLGVEYVDIFYHHRPDSDTPMEESLGALDQIVKSGKALYAGISSYNAVQTADAVGIVKDKNLTPILINQIVYNILNRWIEPDLVATADRHGMGLIAFCPLGQGLLTDKYLKGIPSDSRAGSKTGFLRPEHITDAALARIKKLNDHAKSRGQSLAQMALAWTLRLPQVTSALIGASKPQQIVENVAAFKNASFTEQELKHLDQIVAS